MQPEFRQINNLVPGGRDLHGAAPGTISSGSVWRVAASPAVLGSRRLASAVWGLRLLGEMCIWVEAALWGRTPTASCPPPAPGRGIPTSSHSLRGTACQRQDPLQEPEVCTTPVSRAQQASVTAWNPPAAERGPVCTEQPVWTLATVDSIVWW